MTAAQAKRKGTRERKTILLKLPVRPSYESVARAKQDDEPSRLTDLMNAVATKRPTSSEVVRICGELSARAYVHEEPK